MFKVMATLIGASALVCAAACSDDGDGGGSTLASGLPPDQQLESLTDDDLKKFCDEAEALSKRLVTVNRICTVAAASFAEDRQSCEQFKKQCLQSPPDLEEEAPDPEEPTCVEQLKMQLEGCGATVEELEACTNDAISGALAAFDITCADVPLPMSDEGPFGSDLEKPASCTALEMKCPKLADDNQDFTSSEFPDAGAPEGPDAGQ